MLERVPTLAAAFAAPGFAQSSSSSMSNDNMSHSVPA
jgi:hypothetical protein